jgi:hypothetical protein
LLFRVYQKGTSKIISIKDTQTKQYEIKPGKNNTNLYILLTLIHTTTAADGCGVTNHHVLKSNIHITNGSI